MVAHLRNQHGRLRQDRTIRRRGDDRSVSDKVKARDGIVTLGPSTSISRSRRGPGVGRRVARRRDLSRGELVMEMLHDSGMVEPSILWKSTVAWTSGGAPRAAPWRLELMEVFWSATTDLPTPTNAISPSLNGHIRPEPSPPRALTSRGRRQARYSMTDTIRRDGWHPVVVERQCAFRPAGRC